jgi:circadian clock protein KaiC
MRSIGIDLAPCVERGLLRFESARPTLFGLEMHLARMHRAIEEFAPRVVIIDPLSSFTLAGTRELKVMLIRLLDFMKTRKVTALMTSLTAEAQMEATDTAVSSLIDTWLEVRDIETSGERNRGLYVLKSRGMAHSKQVREFVMSSSGIDLVDVVIGPNGVLTGSARAARDAHEKADAITQSEAIDRQKRALAHRRRALEAQIAAMRAELAAEEESVLRTIDQGLASETRSRDARARVERSRTASSGAPKREGGASR